MKKLFLIMLLSLPIPAFAEHMDVIEFKLLEGCSFDKYMAIVKDFNVWGKTVGYNAQVAVPLQSENLTSMYWLGTSADAATFGKAWDTWRDDLADPNSTPAKLWARFVECSANLSRNGYDVY